MTYLSCATWDYNLRIQIRDKYLQYHMIRTKKMKKKLKKTNYLSILLFFSLFFLCNQRAFAQNDYSFYSNYGHRSSAWNQSVKAGFSAYDSQDCTQSLELLKKAVSMQCKDTLVLYKLAICSEKEENLYTAIQYYELAAKGLKQLKASHRYQNEIYENYGRALFKANRYEEALPLLTQAVQFNNNFSLNYMLGYIHAKSENWSASNEYLKRALVQDTSGVPPQLLARVYFQVAKAQAEQKNYKLAIELLKKSAQLDPNNQEQIAMGNQYLREWQRLQFQQTQKDMLETFTDFIGKDKGKEKGPEVLPPPPAASKLPPLE